jgi:HemY protein
MIRVLFYLVIVAALAFGAVWLAERPGDVAITWQGERIETSVFVLVAAVAAIVVVAVLLWSLLRALVRSPDLIARYLRMRRGVRGYLVVSQGLIAVGSGDARAARRFSDDASRIAPDEPLTLLLAAQAAQLSGDRAGAARTFEAMAGRSDTKLLGLHGLYIEARRRDDAHAAELYAEEAAKEGSSPAWAGQAVLEFRCVAGDWAGALDRLERNYKNRLIDKHSYRRQRAVLLTAQALALEATDKGRSSALALEAIKLAPTLIPAAALAGRLLGASGDLRRAARIIGTAWRTEPHPDLAQAYTHLRPGDSARERLARIEKLTGRTPSQLEEALALARAALDAQEYALARETLTPLTAAPTRRVAALMAELEQQQHGDEGRAREWMARGLNARRDPAWTADGFVCDHWLPVSPVTGRLDAFEWKDPLAGVEGPVIEAEQRALLGAPRERRQMDERRDGARPPGDGEPPAPREPPETREPPLAGGSGGVPLPLTEQLGNGPHPLPELEAPTSASSSKHRRDGQEEPASFKQRLPAPEPPSEPETLPRRTREPPPPLAPTVIPLIHAPDDPGPQPEGQGEPQPEGAAEAPVDAWTRIRQIFKS